MGHRSVSKRARALVKAIVPELIPLSRALSVAGSRVDKDFEDKLRQYLNGDIMNDVQSMVSPRPHTNYLKLLLSKQVEATHKLAALWQRERRSE